MTGGTLLDLDGVSVSFDGLTALYELSLVVEPGEMRAVIGPNGAGKTTMMDVITGKTKPDAGRVVFGDDTDLTRLDEPAIARLGASFSGRRCSSRCRCATTCCWRSMAIALPASRCGRARRPMSARESRRSC